MRVPGDRPLGTVLVVEDDPELRDGLSVLLAQAGYAVATAGDGVEALACLRATSLLQLIVLDLMLPTMDGFEFRVHQLQDANLASIPVVVLSGGDDLERKAQGLGAIATLRKPLDPDALLDQLGKVQRSASTSAGHVRVARSGSGATGPVQRFDDAPHVSAGRRARRSGCDMPFPPEGE
jgi:DNA-binding response OmpR family regulator